MNLDDLKSGIETYLAEDTGCSVAIKGQWGTGKTWFWKNRLEKAFCGKRIAYISLFGKSSLDEIKSQLTIDLSLDRFKLERQVADKIKGIKAIIEGISRAIPYINKLNVPLSCLANKFYKDSIVCFDDFERMDCSKITVHAVMGLISEIKENGGGVVCIFNHDELKKWDDQQLKVFDRYREKVIDHEIEFIITASETAEIAFKDYEYSDKLSELACSLEITNLRTLFSIKAWVKRILSGHSIGDPEDVSELLKSIVVTVLAFSRGALDDYLRMSYFGIPKDTSHGEFLNSLRQKGYGNPSSLDRELAQCIKAGLMSDDKIAQVLKDIKAKRVQDDEGEQIRQLLVGSFEDNANDIAEAISTHCEKYVASIQIYTVNWYAMILRGLLQNDLADRIIEKYLDAHPDIINEYIGHELALTFAELDKSFQDKIEEYAGNAKATMTQEEAILHLLKNIHSGDHLADAQLSYAIPNITKDAIKKVLKQEIGKSIDLFNVQNLLKYHYHVASSVDHTPLINNIKQALREIFDEAPHKVNAYRRSHFFNLNPVKDTEEPQ